MVCRGVVLAPLGGAAWPPPSFGGAAFLPLSCWVVLIGHLFPPGVFFFDKGTGLPCVWFPRAVFGARWFEDTARMSMAVVVWEALCGTREVLVDCGVDVFGRWEKCEVNTRGNDVMTACSTPVSVWRDLLKKLR